MKTLRIGLSLGADICWPLCFERILNRLDLKITAGGDTMRFETERITIEPFDLRQGCRYDIILDRLTHWYSTSREWIKKAIILNDVYVLNNPWTLQSMEKHTTYCAMMRLGLAIPETWMVPPKAYDPIPDLEPTLARYAQMFDLTSVGQALGYPMYMKPYAGGGWVGISRIENYDALATAYEQSGVKLMHLQKSVESFEQFARCVAIGPQVRRVVYDPTAPLHDRYTIPTTPATTPVDEETLSKITLTINSFFGWDFNSAEILLRDGVQYPIDFANACPDSQVTSLHYHFAWLIKAKLRWAIFCAATKRKFPLSNQWPRYFAIADGDGSIDDKLDQYAAIAREHFDTDNFEAFCAEHLPHLDEIAYEFFGSDEARDIIRQKVVALYPAHEVDEFSELFFSRVQLWRAREGR